MSSSFLAGIHLSQLGRFEQAAGEFRRHLSEEPQDSAGHAWLAQCLLQNEQLEEATAEARQAIELDPENDFAYFVLGRAYLERNRSSDARRAFGEAIRLAPEDALNHGFLGLTEMRESRWQAALDAANRGLAFDPENSVCLNVRTTSLTHLGRRDEAATTIAEALANDPDNSWTHANHGLAELHRGRPKEALHHFREALRLDPTNEFARSGIVEALKARNIIYRGMLAFFLWMTRLPAQWRWVVLLAIFFAPNVLRRLGNANPDLAWLTDLAVQLLMVFVVMTWIASPLFNMVLRFDRFGRYALDDEQIRGANLLAVFLFPALALWVASWFAVDPYKDPLFYSAWALGVVVLPAATLYQCDRGWPRNTMLGYLLVLLALSLSVVLTFGVLGFLKSEEQEPPPLMLLLALPGSLVLPLVFYSPIATFFLAQWLVKAKVRQ